MGGDSHPPHRLGLPSRPLPDCLNPETSHLSYSHSRLSNFLQCTMDGSKDGVREHKTQLRQADVTSAGGADRHLEAFSVGRDWENVENQDWSNLCHSLSIFVTLCQSLSIFVTLCHSLSIFVISSLNHQLVCP